MNTNSWKTKAANASLIAATLKRKPLILPRLVKGYFLARFFGKKRLRFMDIALDYRCNMTCTHCSAKNLNQNDRPSITVDDFRRIVLDLMREGCLVFHFTGGEPLLKENLEEYIAAANAWKNLISIQTNGLLATEERLKSLRKVGVDILNVSIDSLDPKVNDRFRNMDGCLEKGIAALEAAKRVGMSVSVATTVSHENLYSKDFMDIIEWTGKNNIWCQFNLAVPIGNWSECSDFMLTESDQKRVRDLVEEYHNVRIDLNHNWHCYGCGAIKEKGYLTSYGDFMPCPFIQISFGNLLEESVSLVRKRALKIPEFSNYSPLCLAAEDQEFIRKTPCYNDWDGAYPIHYKMVPWINESIKGE